MDSLEEVQLPRIIRKTRKIGDRIWMAGLGPRHAKVVFVTPSPLPEEIATEKRGMYGVVIKHEPCMLDSGFGVLFKDLANRQGINMAECFVVPLVRYLPDLSKPDKKPTKSDITRCLPLLEADLAELKPDILVGVGKQAYDAITGNRLRESAVMGLWGWSEQFHCKTYYMPAMTKLQSPDKHERFSMDFAAIRTMLDSMHGISVPSLPVRYEVIHNAQELMQLMMKLQREERKLLCIDCEWEGKQHVDGKLRSLQIAWSESDAAYIRFMGENLDYAFDVSYEDAGRIMVPWWNRPDVKLVGHQISADLPWVAHWLKLDWYGKCELDTEFALQCCDESLPLGLDDLAVRCTDFGKYDIDLIRYLAKNPDKRSQGYGLIPDEILIPYGIKDVLATWRAMDWIRPWLKQQGLEDYYRSIVNPMVSDVFTAFCLNGLPIDVQKMGEMRDLYNYAKREYEAEFRKAVVKEADVLLQNGLQKALEGAWEPVYTSIGQVVAEGDAEAARAILRASTPPERLLEAEEVLEHYLAAPAFNIRSKPQMVRWLFSVKKYTPVKSTANKEAGMPSIGWQKVLAYPPEKQRLFTPATDKQSLEIFAQKYGDKVIDMLLELNAIGNICKAFLKEDERDEEGKVVEAQGLHAWVTSKETMALNHAMTETGRPRAFKPNILNWPSWIHVRLGAGMSRIINQRDAEGVLPARFKKYVGIKPKSFPTIRSVVMAKPGWCMVEADYQTAEMRGLGFIAGDPDLLRLLLEPDPSFAKVKPEAVPEGVDAEDCVCRVSYPPYIEDSPDKEKFLMTYGADGEVKARFTEDQLLRDEKGEVVHTKFDLHWGVIEMARHAPREIFSKKKDRGAGKVINFCVAIDTKILTKQDGYVKVQELKPYHLLWDGVDFVSYKRILKRPSTPTIEYCGLRATLGHLVYTEEYGPTCFFDAAYLRLTLVKTDQPWKAGEGLIPKLYRRDEKPSKALKKRQVYLDRVAMLLQRSYEEVDQRVRTFLWKTLKYCDVYDIVDAGPRHRFTAEGCLVGNSSSYGGQVVSLARKVEADTGVKPTEDEVQDMLDAIERRQPKATAYFHQCELVPETTGQIRAASGRIRHCHIFAQGIKGLSYRTRESVITSLGRECRNFELQESVAATASLACIRTLAFARANKLRGYVCVCLYDSLVVHCPWEERRIWQKALQLYMTASNGWFYHGRILRYPIDLELNAGWSTKPSKQDSELLHDPDWEPTPENLLFIEKWLDKEIAIFDNEPTLSVFNREDLNRN